MSDYEELSRVGNGTFVTKSQTSLESSSRFANDVELPVKPVRNAITARALFARVQARFSTESSTGQSKPELKGFQWRRGNSVAAPARPPSQKSIDCDSAISSPRPAEGSRTAARVTAVTSGMSNVGTMKRSISSMSGRKGGWVVGRGGEGRGRFYSMAGITGRYETISPDSAVDSGLVNEGVEAAGGEREVEGGMDCRLCLDESLTKDVMYRLEQCSCEFCTQCVREYLRVEISEGNVLSITCPDGECTQHGIIESLEIEKLVDEELFEKFKRLKYNKEVDLDPLRTFCPAPGCDGVCQLLQQPPPPPVSQSSGSFSRSTSLAHGSLRRGLKESINSKSSVTLQTLNPQPVHCAKCGLVFCCVCKYTWHDKKTCDEQMKSLIEQDGIPMTSSEDSRIKRCPTCNVPIERNDGCAQMMCSQCKHVFCWHCLTSLDDDFLLRHYDKGQCKNRLGHSRASVIWHRTQVVGIFAGFGMLVLLASPFLLLAAPCILCCKCKSCHLSEDEEGDMLPPSTIT